MLGWIASLGLLLLLFSLPLPGSSPRVGWSTNSSADWIVLSQVADPTSEAEDDTEEGAPPPTQHSQPPEVTSTGTESEGDGEEETEEESTASADSSRTPDVRHVSTLSTADRHPRIIGGKGMLSLHIQYPAAARKKGIEGRLELTFTVGADGDVRNIVVSESLHPLCDSAAVDAVRSVRFQPASYNGESIPVRMSLPIRFQLQRTGPAMPNRQVGSGK
jgi:TonB family protein